MAQRAEPPQHRCDHDAHQSAVAGRERGKSARLIELLVKRPVAAQHALEDLGCQAARGEAGDVVSGGR